MPQLPATIESAIHHQLLAPLIEVLAGQRPARDVEALVTDDVLLRLSLTPRQPLGPVRVRTLVAQRVAGEDALEIAAAVTDQEGRVHPLGVRITRDEHRAAITAVATDLWGP